MCCFLPVHRLSRLLESNLIIYFPSAAVYYLPRTDLCHFTDTLSNIADTMPLPWNGLVAIFLMVLCTEIKGQLALRFVWEVNLKRRGSSDRKKTQNVLVIRQRLLVHVMYMTLYMLSRSGYSFGAWSYILLYLARKLDSY
jgi:hypothetical protein